MSDPRDNLKSQGARMAETRGRDEREPSPAPALMRGRPEFVTRPRQPARMPNGDPPSLMLWGTEEV